MSTQAAMLVGVLLLLTNAFFVGGEFALVSARRTGSSRRRGPARA